MIVRPATRSLWVMFFTLNGSVVPQIWRRLVAMMVLALVITIISHHWPDIRLHISPVPLTLMGLTLAIFLGFRNSVAYERWWEARTLWGEMLVVSRNVVRQICSLPESLSRQTQRELAYRVVAFAHAVRHTIRDSDPACDFRQWLPAEEAVQLGGVSSPANMLLGKLAQDMAQLRRQGQLDSMLLASMDAQLTRLSYAFGGCERIRNTTIPYGYILMLHRTVYIYCLLLPFCLLGVVGWMTPVMVGVLCYMFFGLDALGDQIEMPFDRQPNDLPLDALCRAIEISVLELLGEPAPAPMAAVEGVLL